MWHRDWSNTSNITEKYVPDVNKMLWCHLDVKMKIVTNQQLWECKNLMKVRITQLRLLVYIHSQLWLYALTHHNHAPLKIIVLHHHHNNNEYTDHLIAIRYVAAYKYIQKFWKQTIAGDASLTLQIMSINATYLDISVSNILFTPRHGLYYVSPSSEHNLFLCCMHEI